MKDHFSILPIDALLRILLNQYDSSGSILGIAKNLFFYPNTKDPFQTKIFDKRLETPLGVAAGPHSQLAQNIVVAWLTGARFIELKTVQTLDELNVSKPCIDMQDEGYNCEWSQELKVRESFDQYLDAWILIHILRHKLSGHTSSVDPGFLFNMSVGYDLKGIMEENVQWYLDQMQDASREIAEKIDLIRPIYPAIDEIHIGSQLSDNITLSTMHGCPPEEIGKIGEYLITERGFHTNIKLNPTLLGAEKLHKIMQSSGFETMVPDIAFEHDLKYEAAKRIISNLSEKAAQKGVQFGLKLTNTLESTNHKDIFENEEMMYMSGRALHPIAVNLAAKLQDDFDGTLNISFSGGANSDNICALYKSGLTPVTVCSDLLKPGGYGRFFQYLENLRNCSDTGNHAKRHQFLRKYAESTLSNKAYQKTRITDPNLKTDRPLNYFDCIQAPCISTCPTHQDIPGYLHYTAEGEYEKAYQLIRETNPFPLTTGMICDHLCQTKCVRIHYDSPVLIREVKRFIAEFARDKKLAIDEKTIPTNKTAAVIGAGPSGLSCAYYLAKNGIEVTIYESKKEPGGMISHAIPAFRLTDEAIDLDIALIQKIGVKIKFGVDIDQQKFKDIQANSDFVYIGAGAQRSVKLRLPGIETNNVLDPLEFLFRVKAGSRPELGQHIVIIGGGNTAMDAARTAWRLAGKGARVSIVYRRTIRQMPADQGEIQAVLDEGMEIVELVNPVEIISENGSIKALRCQKMKLGGKDKSSRPQPIPLENEWMEIPVDTLIPAIGQQKVFDFIDEKTSLTTQNNRYETSIPGVFIGGDALRGASTAINAIGDGRKAAEEILSQAGIKSNPKSSMRLQSGTEELMLKKTLRHRSTKSHTNTIYQKDFEVTDKALTEKEAQEEASRCLKCDEVCNICTTVCPNLAFYPYQVTPEQLKIQQVEIKDDRTYIQDGEVFNILQRHQILHIADWCNHCGNCTTFCPTSGKPYLDKPHLYLNKQDFELEKDGFYIDRENGELCCFGYQNGQLYQLSLKENSYIFSSNGFMLKLSVKDLSVLEIIEINGPVAVITEMAAIMHVLMQGAVDFLS